MKEIERLKVKERERERRQDEDMKIERGGHTWRDKLGEWYRYKEWEVERQGERLRER